MKKILKSKTVWVIVFMFVMGGFQAIEGVMSPDIYLFINAGLSALAIHFKLNPSQDYTGNK